MEKKVHAIVSGRVQLVMFRDFTQRKARILGVFGTVQNLPDGTVEVFATGEEKQIDSFLEKLHKGPVLSKVDSVTITKLKDPEEYKGFSIIF